jgi:murein DD-endopeptidase MepM/ murein hydrolase activator NlpD
MPWIRVAVAIGLLGLADLAARAGSPPPVVGLEWQPQRPVQGSLVAIDARLAAGGANGATIDGRLAGEPLHFERSGDGFRALGAIPMDARSAARGSVTLTTADGAASATLAVPVRRRSVRVERLRAADRFARRPDSALRARLTRERGEVNVVLRATHERPRLWSDVFQRPIPGRVLSGFGTARTFNDVVASRHRGVDFAAALGDSIRVANRGVVALVADHYYAGQSVWIDHGAGLLTVYLHMSKTLVTAGDTVAGGRVIGLVGNTGRVTSPHLHWSALYGGISVDPMDLLGATVRQFAITSAAR